MDVGQQLVRERVLKTYFKFFWNKRVTEEMKLDQTPGGMAAWLKTYAGFAAQAAADAAYDARRYNISVRELRAMTDHVFHEMKSRHYTIGLSPPNANPDTEEKAHLRDAALRYLATVPL
ncbi:MAG: hypothetical protein KGO52_15495 [Nitrospirota bacterium]|nr:hypothetical protein [Nitrospirota bacterium]